MQDVFPHMPADVVLADLRITHSVEDTIENIIEERITAPVSKTAKNVSERTVQAKPLTSSYWTVSNPANGI